jgi:hypothetical protein
MLRLCLFALVLPAGFCFLAGCSDGGPKLEKTKVQGKVTLDGQPLPAGKIVFTKDGEIPVELAINDGKYEGEAYAGHNHLQFAVYKPIGKANPKNTPGAEEGQSMQNILPSRYNQESKEFRQLAAGENTFDFELLSK